MEPEAEGCDTVIATHETILTEIRPLWHVVEDRVAHNVARTLEAFTNSGLSTPDLQGSTGYGYDDRGRILLDRVVAEIMGTEAALVRSQWVSGTHAINTVLQALAPTTKRLWVVSGPIYDTMEPILFDTSNPLSLRARGIEIRYVNINEWESRPSEEPFADVIYIQRSRGYQSRPSWGRDKIAPIITLAHRHQALVIVDNCYGEFTDTEEPGHWGADLVVGSLMKNPGGGIAPTGAYVAGNQLLCDRVADQLFAPGIGGEVGPTGPYQRLLAQGWFMAPMVVGEALMGGIYAAALFHRAGFEVDSVSANKNDIVTAIRLGNADRVKIFCAVIQAHSPIDSTVTPVPWSMPGYADPIIMAAGGFVAGASLELSADAPMREPYWVYLQGGLSRWHTTKASRVALEALVAAD